MLYNDYFDHPDSVPSGLATTAGRLTRSALAAAKPIAPSSPRNIWRGGSIGRGKGEVALCLPDVVRSRSPGDFDGPSVGPSAFPRNQRRDRPAASCVRASAPSGEYFLDL